MALLILRAGWQLTRAFVEPLMDTQLPSEEVETVRRVLEQHPEVLGYHKLRTRKSTSFRYFDSTLPRPTT